MFHCLTLHFLMLHYLLLQYLLMLKYRMLHMYMWDYISSYVNEVIRGFSFFHDKIPHTKKAQKVEKKHISKQKAQRARKSK